MRHETLISVCKLQHFYLRNALAFAQVTHRIPREQIRRKFERPAEKLREGNRETGRE